MQKYLQPWKPFISNLSAVYPVSTTFRIRIFHNRQGILLFSLRRATQPTNWVLFAMDTWMIIQVWTMCKHYTDYFLFRPKWNKCSGILFSYFTLSGTTVQCIAHSYVINIFADLQSIINSMREQMQIQIYIRNKYNHWQNAKTVYKQKYNHWQNKKHNQSI